MPSSALRDTPPVARQKSSLLSLRRETGPSPPPPISGPYPVHSKRPPAASSSYFDRYPRPGSSSQPPRPSISISNSNSNSPPPPQQPQQQQPPQPPQDLPNSLRFPSRESTPTKPKSRQPPEREYTRGTRNTQRLPNSPGPPPLRFSGSSSYTFAETPRTPQDSFSKYAGFDLFPVVVAAPVAGVETMDAFVDSMNSSAVDPFFSTHALSRLAPRRDKPSHNPIYHPPLPKPPPGVKLGRPPHRRPSITDSDADDDEDEDDNDNDNDAANHAPPSPLKSHRPRRTSRPHRSPHRDVSDRGPTRVSKSRDDRLVDSTEDLTDRASEKALVPSISEIIRMHGPTTTSSPSASSPPYPLSRSHPSSGSFKQNQALSIAINEPAGTGRRLESVASESEDHLTSRSSIDSVAEEVQATLRTLPTEHRRVADISFGPSSPHSDPGTSASLHTPTSSRLNADEAVLPTPLSSPPSASQAIASYLRSARLTTLLKLFRGPHASMDHPLTVSLCDLGSPTGYPLVVFLGLGCVRHVMGLYDEMAECLGLRIIAIDRWGLGRTGLPFFKSARGIQEWASVVEEVLDQLHIDQCSVMAHSAGAPYALAFANKVPERIRGEICLLAPWVGGSETAGYKWLKYIPNGILKTAQAADWKYQAWQLGKPPTIAYEGIGYTTPSDPSPSSPSTPKKGGKSGSRKVTNHQTASNVENGPRPSMDSGMFSEYDDLKDFEGRFQSRSTLNVADSTNGGGRSPGGEQHMPPGWPLNHKPSRRFLGKLKGGGHSSSQPATPSSEEPPSSAKKLRTLRSLGSLRGKSVKSATSSTTPKSTNSHSASPRLPDPDVLGVGLGLEDLSLTLTKSASPTTPTAASTERHNDSYSQIRPVPQPARKESWTTSSSKDRSVKPEWTPRHGGRRSISLTSSFASSSAIASSSGFTRSSFPSSTAVYSNGSSSSTKEVASSAAIPFQAGLGNALLAASHAEASKGTHADLLQILNHDRKPWGFLYNAYPLHVKVWYGDRDERIPESAVRWMERTMGEDRCSINFVQGADHALLYKSSVVVEVMEHLQEYWKDAL